MNSTPHVLVIDGTSETEAVLKAVLEPRGTHVERTRALNAQKRADEMAVPDVVVIDLDDDLADISTNCFGDSHRVLIGSIKMDVNAGDRFLSKPFQYPELLKTIEDLLTLPHAS